MKTTIWQQLDVLLRNMTPVLVTFCMVIVSVMPLRLPEASFVMPMLVLMSVYFWALHRTDLLPATAVFGIGLFLDILAGMPLGLNAFILLGVFGLCVTQRRFFYNKSFAVIWWGFMVVAAVAQIIEWALMSIYLETLVSPQPVYFRYFMTVALYPTVAWLFVRIQRSLPQETV
ncbi:MAG: rod shape-determining protein MreD [Proteobacteria bacterium]|nr:rod shape-determining protein MreD [Pseudomonadota bacterium]